MPTPTSASWIMDTSLAPSPMASVSGVGETCVLMRRMACALRRGDTRQTTTAEQARLMRTSVADIRASSQIRPSERESITSATSERRQRSPLSVRSSSEMRALIRAAAGARAGFLEPPLPLAWPTAPARGRRAGEQGALSELRLAPEADLGPTSASCSGALRMRSGLCFESRRAAVAMLMAVSILSPVSIHTLIPAARNAPMASGTPGCSRSSMADTPTSRISTSSMAATRSSSSSRASPAACAAACARSHLSAACSSMYLTANTSVRKPAVANALRCSRVFSRLDCARTACEGERKISARPPSPAKGASGTALGVPGASSSPPTQTSSSMASSAPLAATR
mmetsp:Transcript_590/g.1598  ORF Transcript_590/g.1598 Transcript_590/m.1598 type:complete len:341 (-) Transcript_590:711-1733(-)